MRKASNNVLCDTAIEITYCYLIYWFSVLLSKDLVGKNANVKIIDSIISSKNFYYTLIINNNLVADPADIQLLSRSTKEYVFYCVFDVYSQYSWA